MKATGNKTKAPAKKAAAVPAPVIKAEAPAPKKTSKQPTKKVQAPPEKKPPVKKPVKKAPDPVVEIVTVPDPVVNIVAPTDPSPGWKPGDNGFAPDLKPVTPTRVPEQTLLLVKREYDNASSELEKTKKRADALVNIATRIFEKAQAHHNCAHTSVAVNGSTATCRDCGLRWEIV